LINLIRKIWGRKRYGNFIAPDEFFNLKPKKNMKTLADYVKEHPEVKRKEAIQDYKNKFS